MHSFVYSKKNCLNPLTLKFKHFCASKIVKKFKIAIVSRNPSVLFYIITKSRNCIIVLQFFDLKHLNFKTNTNCSSLWRIMANIFYIWVSFNKCELVCDTIKYFGNNVVQSRNHKHFVTYAHNAMAKPCLLHIRKLCPFIFMKAICFNRF